jgi:hypothetical protein
MQDERTAYERLTPPQRMFVDQIVARAKYTEAAKIAYPHQKNPAAYGSKLMSFPRVREAIMEREAEYMQEIGVRTEQILIEMAKVAFMPLSAQSAHAKVRALQCLGLYKGVWGGFGSGHRTPIDEGVSDGTTVPNDSRVNVTIRQFSDGVIPMDSTDDRHLRLISNAD